MNMQTSASPRTVLESSEHRQKNEIRRKHSKTILGILSCHTAYFNSIVSPSRYDHNKAINYFESFSPIASFVTIQTLFALTVLPMFNLYKYDVQVAFVESAILAN